MDTKDEFDLLYASLVDTFKGYVENVMKTLASIIIAIGWILTSESSRTFLKAQRSAYVMVLVAVLIISALHAGVSVAYYWRSRKKMDLLEGLKDGESAYVKPAYYAGYQITPLIIAVNLLMNLSLFAVLFTTIYTLR